MIVKQRKLARICLALLLLILIPTTAPQAQNASEALVRQLLQQAAVVGPTDPAFIFLQQALYGRLGLSAAALTGALWSGPFGSPLQQDGLVYTPLVASQGLDLKRIASGQIAAALLGLLQPPPNATLGGVALPSSLGLAAMTAGPFVVALVSPAMGQAIAFVLLPVSPILTAPSFTDAQLLSVLAGLIQSGSRFVFPLPLPVAFACPALAVQQPFIVQAGSGLPLVTVVEGTAPLLEVRDGGGQGPELALEVVSFGPVLSYTLLAGEGFHFGLIFGAGSKAVALAVGVPFRLLVTAGERTACLYGQSLQFGFGALLLGTASYN